MIRKTELENRTMLTDLYQLTMDAAYYDSKKNESATFELFIRKLPENWGYFIANGIEDAVDYATNIHFTKENIDFFRERGLFSEEHLSFFKNFRFTGDIYCVREGTPVTTNAPILRVRAPRTESQFLESLLLNTINFQTLVASKARRVVDVAAPATIVEFGLRRAQEMDAAVKGARAAYIAGAVATSNVYTAEKYGIPWSGTQAHSFVMTFPSEIESFRAYVKTFPKNATLLIDTYDTLQGARSAALVAKELEMHGGKLGAVRLDSGDLAELSKEVRKILHANGLNYVKIFASNDLNEYKIAELKRNGAVIDAYGVGTELITAKPVAAISGVYKLVEDESGAKIKLSQDKASYPGRKQIYRIEKNGEFINDILALENENIEGTPLLEKIVENGERIIHRRNLEEIREYCINQINLMPQRTRQIAVEKPYEIHLSPGLKNLTSTLRAKYRGGGQ